ncbi:LytR/AlgR family response regulator transcription factor [Olivibacter sitiensis]|uniref:LytR/AlgR family response regulator transcription factor n=1 Tax=Olivibacter sitiensis TaxID=376470 RepID=UPI000487DC60|nr:LytTR family DNA-binding domain-containing protein [Olivibacter sitiensis]
MTLRCILLDDELPGLRYLRSICEQFTDVEVVRAFDDPQKFLLQEADLDYDTCIMDIQMPLVNGVEVASRLNNKAIIFVTAYKEYAANAFDLEAVDYIVKPIQPMRLRKAIDKVVKVLEAKKDKGGFAQLNSNRGKILLYFYQIAFISVSESDKRDKQVVLDDDEVVLKNISFDQLLQLLPANEFLRINRQTIIAKRIVLSYTHDSVLTKRKDIHGKHLGFQLSENYRKAFLENL